MEHSKEQVNRRQEIAIDIKKWNLQILKHQYLQGRNNIKKKPKT
jgi:hypothetical protein